MNIFLENMTCEETPKERLHFKEDEISRLKYLTRFFFKSFKNIIYLFFFSLNFVKFSLNPNKYLPEKILLYKVCFNLFKI